MAGANGFMARAPYPWRGGVGSWRSGTDRWACFVPELAASASSGTSFAAGLGPARRSDPVEGRGTSVGPCPAPPSPGRKRLGGARRGEREASVRHRGPGRAHPSAFAVLVISALLGVFAGSLGLILGSSMNGAALFTSGVLFLLVGVVPAVAGSGLMRLRQWAWSLAAITTVVVIPWTLRQTFQAIEVSHAEGCPPVTVAAILPGVLIAGTVTCGRSPRLREPRVDFGRPRRP